MMGRKPTYDELRRSVKDLASISVIGKWADEALSSAESRYSQLFETIPIGIYRTDKEGRLLDGNPALIRMLGHRDFGSLQGMHLSEIVPPDDFALLQEGLEKDGTTQALRMRLRQFDGSLIWVENTAVSHMDDNGLVLYWEGMLQDVTPLKRAEQKLEKGQRSLDEIVEARTAELIEANEQLRKAIEERSQTETELRETNKFLKNILDSSSSISIVSTDLDSNVLFWNKGAEKIFGYTADEIVGRQKIDILYPDEKTKDEVKKIAASVFTEKKGLTCEIKELTKGGQELWINSTLTPRLDENGQIVGILGIGENITERKRAEAETRELESQLRRAQKIESIGTLAGGIAHDFNNLLMAILGNVSLMSLDLPPTHPHFEPLKSIEKQVRSGANLTSQLLGYARKGRYEVKTLNLNELLMETTKTFSRTRKEITIHLDLSEDLFLIEADRGQMEQVLLNLYVNAADAMPAGGDLTLKTSNMSQEEMKQSLYQPKLGNYVFLQVKDSGTGMDEKTMERIFEPFFTTKDRGRGTGLGLASVYGIIKGHGGYIDVRSEKGHGSTFSVYLPASQQKAAGTKEMQDTVIEGSGTILLVDDEEMVLEIGVKLLRRLGYQVLEARGGRRAVEIYKAKMDRINMVILDMIMPDIGGGQAFDRMKELNPQVKVLLSSGYSLDGQATAILKRGCAGFIQKPFTIKDLSQKIKDILEKDSRAEEKEHAHPMN
jgi:PAS domain S-box-containing protein